MKGSAPNCSATGSQVDVTRKSKPNFSIATEDPIQSCQPIRIISTTTASAIASVSHSNALSPKRDGDAMRAWTERSSTAIDAATAIKLNILISSGRPLRYTPRLHLDFVDSFENALLKAVGQWRILQIRRHFLAVLRSPPSE